MFFPWYGITVVASAILSRVVKSRTTLIDTGDDGLAIPVSYSILEERKYKSI